MSDRGILLDVVGDEMGVAACEIASAGRQRPKVVGKNLILERKVQQVVGETVCAEPLGAFLRFVIDPRLRRLADPRGFQAAGNLGVREADDRSLVEVVKELTVETIALDLDRIEIACVEERPDDTRRVILRCFQRQEDRRAIGRHEPGRRCHARPEQLHHALSKAAKRHDCNLAAPRHGRRRDASVYGDARVRWGSMIRIESAGTPSRNSRSIPPKPCRLARSSRPFQEDSTVEREIDDTCLGGGEGQDGHGHSLRIRTQGKLAAEQQGDYTLTGRIRQADAERAVGYSPFRRPV